MKKAYRKYFVVSLSLMLILSNFSFATQLMFCEMTGDSNKCECNHNNTANYPGISFTQEKNKCCEEKTSELTNSNTLLNYNNSQEHDSFVNLTFFHISAIDLAIINSNTHQYLPQDANPPHIDIPVLNSSLLI